MPSSGMLRPAALVRSDFSEERIASIIRVTRIGELGKTLAATSDRSTVIIEAIRYSETLVLITTTRRNILEDGILVSRLVRGV
jgi:hypothetical protein